MVDGWPEIGDPVKLDGRLIGHIVRIEPDGLSKDGQRATITLNKPVRLPLP